MRVEANTYIKVSVLRDSNLKLEDLNVSHTLGGEGEGIQYLRRGTRRKDDKFESVRVVCEILKI